jgi:hypothetical protein
MTASTNAQKITFGKGKKKTKKREMKKEKKCFDSIRRIIFTVFIAGLPDGLFSNQKYKFG